MTVRCAIVFGGAGFIGCHLLKRLVDGRCYNRLYSVDIARPRFTDERINYVNFDIRNAIPADLCGEGPFDIFNLAAVHTTPGHEDWEYYWTNVAGATNVCRFASEVNTQRLLFTSTMMVYGPTEAPKDEDAVLEPVNAYGRSKILAEGIHRLWQAERPEMRRLTIVRPGVIYGLAEHGNFTRLSRALRQRRFVYPGRTDTIKACGYIEDLISAIIKFTDHNQDVMLYNFCHPQRYTSKDICSAFSMVAGYTEPKIVLPFWLLTLIALAFESLSTLGIKTDINRARVKKLYESTNMVPSRLIKMGFEYQFDLITGLEHWKRVSPDFD